MEEREWPNGAQLRFREADYNLLTFEEQILTDATTDVMVGPHGAGLMHNIFMPDRAVLVELHVDNSGEAVSLMYAHALTLTLVVSGTRAGANQHFHNLAHWQGRKYVTRTMGNPIDVSQLTKTIAQVVEDIDLKTF